MQAFPFSMWNSGSAFNVLTDLPWDALWIAGTNTFNTGSTPATDGQTVQNWGDAIGNTKTLTQATSGLRPNFRSSVAAFNNRSTVQGNVAANAVLKWARGSNLAAPYTVVVIGAHSSGLTTYATLVADQGSTADFFVWLRNDTTVSEQSYTSGTPQCLTSGNYDTNANLWFSQIASGSTASRFGKNGPSVIGIQDANDFTGLTLFEYPTTNAFWDGGHVAVVGVLPAAATSYTKWPSFLRWVESTYGITLTTRATIVCDGDSRTTGSGFARSGAEAYVAGQFQLTWPYLAQAAYTDKVTTITVGKSGRTMATQNSTDAAIYVDPVKSEFTIGSKYIVICINAAYNDLAAGDTAKQAYARIVTYVAARQSAGWQVLIGTCPMGLGADNTKRVELNLLITTNGVSGSVTGANADGIVDIALDADTTSSNPFAWSDSTTPYTPANYNVDKIHFSTLGNAIIQGYVETALAASPFSVT